MKNQNTYINSLYAFMVLFVTIVSLLTRTGNDDFLLFQFFLELMYLPIVFGGPFLCAYALYANIKNKPHRKGRVLTIVSSSIILMALAVKFYFAIVHHTMLF